MNKINILLQAIVICVICGCSPQIKKQPSQKAHQSFVNNIVKPSSSKQKSWAGEWIFTIANKDRHLETGTIISELALDNSNQEITVGKRIDSKSFKPEDIVYVGFLSLNKGSESYDVFTNAKNAIRNLEDFTQNNNELKWRIEYKGDPKSHTFRNGMKYITKASYNPDTDTLNGSTDFGMIMDFERLNKTTQRFEEAHKYIPMGSYLWNASRISTSDFKGLTKSDAYNTNLPLYLISVDLVHPAIEKILYN